MQEIKIVRYQPESLEIHQYQDGQELDEKYGVKVGIYAWLYAYNHYKLGSGRVRTSLIKNIDLETGVIETLNTLYIPSNDIFEGEEND